MQPIPLETDVSALCSAGCGGIIKEAYFPQSVDELTSLSEVLSESEYVILGRITNTLVLEDYAGAAVFCGLMKGISLNGDTLRVRSGETFSSVCEVAQSASLGGLENFFGLPGSVGGALSGNSGCFGSSVGELVKSVTVFRLDDGEVEELSGEEIAFGYRYCNLRKNKDFIVDVTFKLYPEDRRRIAEKMADVRKKRRLSQPAGRSLGCFFKQYHGVSAGYYIEQAGLKGYTANGVTVSKTHANFLINEGGSARDYLEAANTVERTVYEKLGIKLEREVTVIGEEYPKKHCHGRTLCGRG